MITNNDCLNLAILHLAQLASHVLFLMGEPKDLQYSKSDLNFFILLCKLFDSDYI